MKGAELWKSQIYCNIFPFSRGFGSLGTLITAVNLRDYTCVLRITHVEKPPALDGNGRFSSISWSLASDCALTIFGGGIAIIAGFLTPLAAFGLTSAMAVALSIHLANGVPFMKPPDAPGVSYEASLVYLGIAILFMFVGPGSLSLDSLLFTYFFD